jgi:thioesterase domain-containing protein
LKPGRQETPVLIAHGLEGRACFSALAKHIATDQAIYGVQAKGLDGLEEPLERIEDMAAFYLEELMQLQPNGPFFLIGYSFGGLVALEMAQRLAAQGKKVALLAMLDSYPHPRYFNMGQRAYLLAKRIRGHASKMRRMPIARAVSYFGKMVAKILGLAPAGSAAHEQESRLSFGRNMRRIEGINLRAMAGYRPRYYRGTLKFVRPEVSSFLPNHPKTIWKKLAEKLEVETVPGDHLGMVDIYYEELAAVLTRYVAEATGQEADRP